MRQPSFQHDADDSNVEGAGGDVTAGHAPAGVVTCAADVVLPSRPVVPRAKHWSKLMHDERDKGTEILSEGVPESCGPVAVEEPQALSTTALTRTVPTIPSRARIETMVVAEGLPSRT